MADEYAGAGLVALLRSDWRAKAVLGGIIALVVAGIVAGAALSSTSETVADRTAATPQDPVVLPTACDDPDVSSAVETALARDTESAANRLLAFPSEVPGGAAADQADAWDELTPAVRAFQLCLHLMQEGVHSP